DGVRPELSLSAFAAKTGVLGKLRNAPRRIQANRLFFTKELLSAANTYPGLEYTTHARAADRGPSWPSARLTLGGGTGFLFMRRQGGTDGPDARPEDRQLWNLLSPRPERPARVAALPGDDDLRHRLGVGRTGRDGSRAVRPLSGGRRQLHRHGGRVYERPERGDGRPVHRRVEEPRSGGARHQVHVQPGAGQSERGRQWPQEHLP